MTRAVQQRADSGAHTIDTQNSPEAGTLNHVTIAVLEGQALIQAVDLFQRAFEFSDAECFPAWEMHALTSVGGLALGAVVGHELVAASYAVPAFDGEHPYLFSTGLATEPGMRARGLGRRLKLAQRTEALRRGYSIIRWTTDSLNAPALSLYLNRLGARLIGIAPAFYGPYKSSTGCPSDEVWIEWHLHRDPGSTPLTDESVLIEVPWDAATLRRDRPGEVEPWVLRTRSAIEELIDQGLEGVEVNKDRPRRTCSLRFQPAMPHRVGFG